MMFCSPSNEANLYLRPGGFNVPGLSNADLYQCVKREYACYEKNFQSTFN